jgi:hypothetical protein
MDEIDEAVEKLNLLAVEVRENWAKGIPPRDFTPYEEAVRPLLQLFRGADLTLRTRITSELTSYAKDQLVGYARKMAVYAVRRQSPQLIVDGLTALAIEAGTSRDYRESVRTLPWLYHSALKLGMDAPNAFTEAASLVVNDFQKAIGGFPFREDRDLASWDLREKMTKDGFDYG